MENPSSWTRAEQIVSEEYKKWCKDRDEMHFGMSLPMRVCNALRAEGLLPAYEEPPVT